MLVGQQTGSSNSNGQLQNYEFRKFDQDLLNQYRTNGDYEYKVYKEAPKGAFQRFLDNIKNWYYRLIRSSATRNVINIIFYLCCFVALIFFIIKLFDLETNSVFRKKETFNDPFQIHEGQLDEIDFKQELQRASQTSQWKLFIRLSYLYTLKSFSDAGEIVVKKGKTNRDYSYELSSQELKSYFYSLSYLFEYTWYGHFEADQEMARKAEACLKDISTQLGTKS